MNGAIKRPPRIILFDLGNVVVDWCPVRLYTSVFGDRAQAERFCRDICTMDWHLAHDKGVSFAENAAQLIANFPEHEANIRLWRTHWLDMFEGYVPGMPQLMADLEARHVPLYGLSNLSAEIAEETFDAFAMIKILRDIVISGAEGVIKPDPQIYSIALARMGNPDPADVLFIDDRADNIEAAEVLGFQGHLFKTADDLRAELTQLGLLNT